MVLNSYDFFKGDKSKTFASEKQKQKQTQISLV